MVWGWVAKEFSKAGKREDRRKQRLSEMEGGREEYRARKALQQLDGVGEKTAGRLYNSGFRTPTDAINARKERLKEIDGVGEGLAKKIKGTTSPNYLADYIPRFARQHLKSCPLHITVGGNDEWLYRANSEFVHEMECQTCSGVFKLYLVTEEVGLVHESVDWMSRMGYTGLVV